MHDDIAIAPQFRQYADEFRTIAAYLLNLAADYDRLARAADVIAESQKAASTDALPSVAYPLLAGQPRRDYDNPMTESAPQHLQTSKNNH